MLVYLEIKKAQAIVVCNACENCRRIWSPLDVSHRFAKVEAHNWFLAARMPQIHMPVLGCSQKYPAAEFIPSGSVYMVVVPSEFFEAFRVVVLGVSSDSSLVCTDNIHCAIACDIEACSPCNSRIEFILSLIFSLKDLLSLQSHNLNVDKLRLCQDPINDAAIRRNTSECVRFAWQGLFPPHLPHRFPMFFLWIISNEDRFACLRCNVICSYCSIVHSASQKVRIAWMEVQAHNPSLGSERIFWIFRVL
mmetsp:Transcript_31098/g.54620  ORF Transcript_31098/g.54620 Transcript_31098/m.54620 type:complete len:249 (-) Transcript_31098:1228-1974(-)